METRWWAAPLALIPQLVDALPETLARSLAKRIERTSIVPLAGAEFLISDAADLYLSAPCRNRIWAILGSVPGREGVPNPPIEHGANGGDNRAVAGHANRLLWSCLNPCRRRSPSTIRSETG